jgi:hypothetical protein
MNTDPVQLGRIIEHISGPLVLYDDVVAVEKERDELKALLEKNEGRIKNIVDESLLRRVEKAEAECKRLAAFSQYGRELLYKEEQAELEEDAKEEKQVVVEVALKSSRGAKKSTVIVVNGCRVGVWGEMISFDEVVRLAKLSNSDLSGRPVSAFTVTWRFGCPGTGGASMIPGDKVLVEEGMIFNAVVTDNG